jgi:hypothetical protein
VQSAINDEETAVIVLIDSHYNDETYLKTREGRHLPILHANTEDERLIYGSTGKLFEKYYDKEDESYKSCESDGIWFIYKSQFGFNNMTEEIDYELSESVDEILKLLNKDSNLDKLYDNGIEFVYDSLYESSSDLSSIEFIPEEITISGVATNICVLSNAIILQTEFPQAEIFIHENSVASYDDELHKDALNIMKGLGMNVIK